MKLGILKLGVVALVAALAVAACGSDDDEMLVLRFNGLEALSSGFHYEGWAIIDGAPVSTGKFNVNANGALVDLDGDTIDAGEFETGVDLTEASAIVLTIEPAGDTDAVPAATKLLGGAVSGRSASLRASHGAALGDDFTSASADYILATHSNVACNAAYCPSSTLFAASVSAWSGLQRCLL